jgi:tetratricopeptide (TPR) repeat protein
MSEAGGARFVAVARTRYETLPTIPQAATDAQQLAQLLRERHGFQVIVLPDLGRGELLDALEAQLAPAGSPQGSLIVLWTGHGEKAADGSLQLMGVSGKQDVVVITPARLGELAALTGARQVLLLVDTCFSGSAVVDAARLANAVVATRAAPGGAWFGVLAASLADEPALAGALGRALMRLLQHGPREPDMRWSPKHPFIRGDDLVQALLADWDEPRHTPFPISFGRAWNLVRNPLHAEDVADRPVEHLLRAAHGSAGDESFFTGRERPLGRLVSWLARGTAGLMVVTGPPGCGKSAVLGRIVSLSSPAERARLLAKARVAAELDPGANRIDLQLQAHSATVESAALALARQLGVDPDEGRWGVLAAASARRQQGRPLTIAVDGLDEARGFSQELVIELLQPLSLDAQVIVTTRDLPVGNSTLVRLLGAASNAEVLDLDEDPAATLRDVHAYVMRRLADVAATMDPEDVADELTRPRAGSSAPFLFARLVTSQLREQPVNTGEADWRLALSRSVESALERDLQSVVLTVDGQPQPQAARELLRALALAHGNGFPADDVWPAVATALSWTGMRYGRDHAYAALTALARHIVASSEGAQPVYRIAHQQLIDYLAADASRDPARPPALKPRVAVAGAIADTYEQWLDDGGAPRDHAYLWRAAWRHLAEGGASGLARLQKLAERDPEAFHDHYATGCQFAGLQAYAQGRLREALTLGERSVALRRERGEPLQLAVALLHLSVTRLAAGDEDGGERAAGEAAVLARSAGDDPKARGVLGDTLLAQAMSQLRDGNYRLAKRLADELAALEPPGPPAADSWRRMSSAYAVAAIASMMLDDLEGAERLGRLAVELCRSRNARQEEPVVYLESHTTLANVLYLRALMAGTGEDGRWPAVDLSIGQAVLDEYRRVGRRGDMGDMVTAKGLLFMVRSRQLNLARGWPDDPSAPPLLELLDQCIDLCRSQADEVVDAATILASCLTQRVLLSAGDVDAAKAGLDEAIAILRRFATSSRVTGIELGIVLDLRTRLDTAAPMAADSTRHKEAVKRQQEATSLMRLGKSLPHRLALADALSRLALLLQGTAPDNSRAAREEAIAVQREIAGSMPEVQGVLVGNLVDRVAELINQRVGEAAELGQEALRLAKALPSGPQTALLVGLAEINLSGALFNLEQYAGVEDMLEDALQQLQAAEDIPAFNAAMGVAHLNLSQLHSQQGRFDDALLHAREAMRRLDRPDVPATAIASRRQALAALGRAERGTGAFDQGTATLRGLIDQLRQMAPDSAEAMSMVMAVDLAAPDLWDESISALGDQPELVRGLTLLRRRPRAEIAATVRTLVDALDGASPRDLREARGIARTQRERAKAEFDEAWRAAMGDVPAWLQVDGTLEWAAIGWWNVPTWALSRDYLAAHPVLLDPRTDLLLEEFGFGREDRSLVDRHLQLLAAAREHGVEAAYAPLLLDIEIGDWLRSDEPDEHLAQHPELLRAEVLTRLREGVIRGELSLIFAAIAELAQRGEADFAFSAATEPATMGDELRAACRSSDVSRLHALATIVVNVEGAEGPVQRQAALALAIAKVVLPGEQPLSDALRGLIASAEPAEHGALTAMVTDSIAQHPAAAPALVALLPLINSPPRSGERGAEPMG